MYIPTLNGWRAIAVLLVVGAHSSMMLTASDTHAGLLAASILSHGGIGVDIFFAISGFLICTLLLEEKDSAGSISLAGFYTRRAFRILPPLFCYLAVVLVLRLNGFLSVPFSSITAAAFFFKNYSPYGGWYVDQFWSLSVEEHFYLFVPLVLALLRPRQSLQFSLIAVTVCASIRLAEYILMPSEKVEFRTEARLDAIMYGVIAALLIHEHGKTILKVIQGHHVLLAVGVAATLCAIFPAMPFRRTVIGAVMPLPIVFTALHPESLLGRILESAPLQWIGRLSYSIYVWHMLFVVEVGRTLGALQQFPLAFVATIACAAASYYCIERPSIRLGRLIAARCFAAPELS